MSKPRTDKGIDIGKNFYLGAPAQDAVRHLLQKKIATVTRAEGLIDSGSEEALHRFRVALRRLRTLLKSYRSEFDPGAKLQSQLKRLSDSTNLARDQEVLIVWIESLRGLLTIPEEAINAIVIGLRDQTIGGSGAEVDYAAVKKRWQKISTRLSSRLSHSSGHASSGSDSRFDKVSGELIQHLADQLQQKLQDFWADENIAAVHAARIAGKRLRYTLEPLNDSVAPVQGALALLSRLQDEMGTMNDRAVFVHQLSQYYRLVRDIETVGQLNRAIAADTLEPSELELPPVILRLIERAATEQQALYRGFADEWPALAGELFVTTDEVISFLGAGRQRDLSTNAGGE